MEGPELRRCFSFGDKIYCTLCSSNQTFDYLYSQLPIGICETQIKQIAYMPFYPATARMQASGKFKSKSIKERKDEKANDAYNGSWIDRLGREWDGAFVQKQFRCR
jgi:hypothetical protein